MLIERLRNAFKKRDTLKLKKISNHAIEVAAMTEDKEMVNISLIAYCLYKLLSKEHMHDKKNWELFLMEIEHDLENAVRLRKKGESLEGLLEEDIIQDITKMDIDYGNYAKDIVHKARIKQASRIYSMGLSMPKAIELTGADRIQLYGYVGTTKIHDRPFTATKSVSDRLKHVRSIFQPS